MIDQKNHLMVVHIFHNGISILTRFNVGILDANNYAAARKLIVYSFILC